MKMQRLFILHPITLRGLTIATVVLFCLNKPAMAAMYKIDNPADKMYNPASKISNPAANIYNPATRIDNQNPLSPAVQPVPLPAVKESKEVTTSTGAVKQDKQLKPAIPWKKYHFKSVRQYLTAAKKAFTRDDYMEFLSVTEDALRRISAGTLKSSGKEEQKLLKYQRIGYELLEDKDGLNN